MNEIVTPLKRIHESIRLNNGDVSSHTKSAIIITKKWQQVVENKEKSIKSEVRVSPNNNEKIDIVDYSTSTAYELKVSGKNVHHEFYKDIAKILTHNEYNNSKIYDFVFISESYGIDILRKRLDPKFLNLLERDHSLTVKLVSL